MSDTRAPIDGRKRLVFFSLLAIFAALLLALLYLGIVAARGSYAYYQFKIQGHSWVGQMWKHHPDLGYVHVPEFQGQQGFWGFSTAVHIDADGFRVPVAEVASSERPLVLALGDSFSFGQGVEAEQTYPFLFAKELGGSVRNSSVSGYGLSQMALHAEELIPRLKPDYVVALHANWLLRRSWLGFSESRLAAIPTPYFVEAEGGGLRTQSPSHEPIIFGMGLQRYWATDPGVLDYLSFVVRAAVPVLIHNDFNRAVLWLQWKTGLLEPPVVDPVRIAGESYRRMAEVCRENGATLVIVSWPTKRSPMLEALPGVVVSYPQVLFKERLPGASPEEYSQAYQHWSESPPKMIDAHPNVRAHELIAEDIMTSLRAAGVIDAPLDAAARE